jgi:hypothetical protein
VQRTEMGENCRIGGANATREADRSGRDRVGRGRLGPRGGRDARATSAATKLAFRAPTDSERPADKRRAAACRHEQQQAVG